MTIIERTDAGGRVSVSAEPSGGLEDVRPQEPQLAGRTAILHAVGTVTDSVSRVLDPVIAALAGAGCRQVVVAQRGGQASPSLLTANNRLASWVLVGREDRPTAAGDWLDWVGAVRQIQRTEPLTAVHLHGFVPYALGRFFMSGLHPVPLVYTPHGSKALTGSGISHRLVRAAASVLRPSASERTLVGSEVDALLLQSRSTLVHRTKVAVDPAYFAGSPHKAERPLVASGVLDDPSHSAQEFARLAVLIGDTSLAGADFEWVGPADPATRTLFKAAHVQVSDDPVHRARAARLARGWMFVCPTATHGMPGHLIEAAACGLPVVAIDSPLHRELVRDGETGFVCGSLSQMVERVRLLLADDRLRSSMGDKALRWARAAAASNRAAPDLLAFYGLNHAARS
jgi:glycosyltransferase involved in cell wall biosynthesis